MLRRCVFDPVTAPMPSDLNFLANFRRTSLHEWRFGTQSLARACLAEEAHVRNLDPCYRPFIFSSCTYSAKSKVYASYLERSALWTRLLAPLESKMLQFKSSNHDRACLLLSSKMANKATSPGLKSNWSRFLRILDTKTASIPHWRTYMSTLQSPSWTV